MKCQRTKQKGAALMTVLVAMMVITILLFEFQYAAMVERKLAYNDLNQTQAYYLAKSGARIGMLRVALFARLKNHPQLKSIGMDPNLIAPYLEQIWSLSLPPFPPSLSTVNKLTKADRDAAEKALEETKISEGQYTVTIRSESSKINLNSLVVPQNKLNERPNFAAQCNAPYLCSAQMLVNLLAGFLRDSENPYEEYPDLRPEELVADIMDWVSPGDSRLMGGNKDAFYQALTPPYKAKKGRFFTVEELRLVRGMTERIFEKLRPHITVYSYESKINLNSANNTLLRAIYPDFTDDDLKRLAEYKSQIGTWSSDKMFADYVTQTLGRSGFATLYPEPSKYPFTVGTESFLIESLGVIPKSASSVQRSIKVALAFSTAAGGTIIPGIQSEAECNKSPTTQFWNAFTSQCVTNPRNEQECRNGAGGGWMDDGSGRMGCRVQQANSSKMVYPPQQKPGTKTPGSNTMKVLYWTES
jgi:type II secretory pathway component PulK